MPVREQATDERLQQFFDAMGGEAAIHAMEEDAAAGAEFLDRHHEELTERYPDEWIALRRDQVVGHARDLGDLSRTLTGKGVDRRGLVFHFMTTSDRTLLL